MAKKRTRLVNNLKKLHLARLINDPSYPSQKVATSLKVLEELEDLTKKLCTKDCFTCTLISSSKCIDERGCSKQAEDEVSQSQQQLIEQIDLFC